MRKLLLSTVFIVICLHGLAQQAHHLALSGVLGIGKPGYGTRVTYSYQSNKRFFMRFDATYMESKQKLGLGEDTYDFVSISLLNGGIFLNKPTRFRSYLGAGLMGDLLFTKKSPTNQYIGFGHMVFTPYLGFNFYISNNIALKSECRASFGKLLAGEGAPNGYDGRAVNVYDLSIGLNYTFYK